MIYGMVNHLEHRPSHGQLPVDLLAHGGVQVVGLHVGQLGPGHDGLALDAAVNDGVLCKRERNFKGLEDKTFVASFSLRNETIGAGRVARSGRSKYRPLIAQKRTLQHKPRKFYRPQPDIWAFIAVLLTNIFAKMSEISPNFVKWAMASPTWQPCYRTSTSEVTMYKHNILVLREGPAAYVGTVVGSRRGVKNGPAGGIRIFPAGGGEGYWKIAKRAQTN